MRKTIIVILSCVLMFLFSSTSHAISLELVPSMDSVFVNDIFSIDLVVSGLGNEAAPSVGSFDLNVAFDPLIFAYVDHSLGPYLGDISLGEAIDWSPTEPIFPGIINLNELSLLDAYPDSGPSYIPPYLDEMQPASFNLASLTFRALDPADGSLMQIQIDETLGQGVFDSLGYIFDDIDASGESLIDVVKPVPEPATILLVMSGLTGLGIFGRKRFGKQPGL